MQSFITLMRFNSNSTKKRIAEKGVMKMFQAGSVACLGLFCTLSDGFQRSICYFVGRELSLFGLNTQGTGLPESANYMGWSPNEGITVLYLCWT